MRAIAIWSALVGALAVPLILAAQSPLLAWRQPVYILAGFAGIAGLGLMLVQPLLAAGWLSGLPPRLGRRMHRWVGITLVLAVVLHVAGLWITSPPDVIDALLLVSPTPFSDWGVVAMWTLFAAALLALARQRARVGPVAWRVGHTSLVLVSVICTALHALLVDGTMETVSKAALCLLVALATVAAIIRLKAWRTIRKRARQARD